LLVAHYTEKFTQPFDISFEIYVAENCLKSGGGMVIGRARVFWGSRVRVSAAHENSRFGLCEKRQNLLNGRSLRLAPNLSDRIFMQRGYRRIGSTY
jgi:hypothetical protein